METERVNKSDRADAYLTVYVICGTLRCLIDELVTATMHEKLAPLSLAIEPEINVNSSNSTENERLFYPDNTFSFSTTEIHLMYNLSNEMCYRATEKSYVIIPKALDLFMGPFVHL